MSEAIREASLRRADTLARLAGDLDVWVATASGGRPHLVPLSLAWDGRRVILAAPAASPTARNAGASGEARLALGSTRDVTVLEVSVEVVPCLHADEAVAACYLSRTGWDPREEEVEHVYLVATPRTVRAWQNVAEIEGRTLMRGGSWTT